MRIFFLSLACVLTLSTVASGLAEYSATITRHLLLYGDLDLRGNPDVENSQSEITWLAAEGTSDEHRATATWREAIQRFKVMVSDGAGNLIDVVRITTETPEPEVEVRWPVRLIAAPEPVSIKDGEALIWLGADGALRVKTKHNGRTSTTVLAN